MKIYLVGGAVRDTLLDIEVKERDWVVVGATPEAMIELGYKQVGSDFPVFLFFASKIIFFKSLLEISLILIKCFIIV